MELQQIVERVADIRHARPSANVRQRVQEAADALSRAGDIQMRVELANEALTAFTAILYQADSDGVPANIDPVTWRLLVPAPWGRGGWQHWGLRSWEAQVLGKILRIRCDSRKHVNLFDYNEISRTWHLNLSDYGAIDQAMAYLKAQPITLEEWRKHAGILTTAARERMARSRKNRR